LAWLRSEIFTSHGSTGSGHEQPAVPADPNSYRSAPVVTEALDWVDVAAMLGDYGEALAWLDYVERVEGGLPPEYAERRRAWLRLVAR
jgi:hypothetical protein